MMMLIVDDIISHGIVGQAHIFHSCCLYAGRVCM